jgi:hypothetical protein
MKTCYVNARNYQVSHPIEYFALQSYPSKRCVQSKYYHYHAALAESRLAVMPACNDHKRCYGQPARNTYE